MTVECVICGKIQPQYAKAFVRRKSKGLNETQGKKEI